MTINEFPMAECIRCGYRWPRRVHKPKTCPECQSRDWDRPFKRRDKVEQHTEKRATVVEPRRAAQVDSFSEMRKRIGGEV